MTDKAAGSEKDPTTFDLVRLPACPPLPVAAVLAARCSHVDEDSAPVSTVFSDRGSVSRIAKSVRVHDLAL